MPGSETLNRIKDVIRRSLKLGAHAPMDDDMLLIGGDFEIDSLDILLIVTELEKEFGIRIVEGGVNRAAFTSVRTLGDFVEQARAVA